MGIFSRFFKSKELSESCYPDLVGYGSASGVSVNQRSVERHGIVFSCVKVLAEDVAKSPCILYRKQKNGDRSRETGHSLYPLLHDAPNDFQNAFSFWETCLYHLNLRGNFYAAIIRRSRSQIGELIYIHPDRVEVKQNSDFSLTYKISGANGRVQEYGRDDIFHICGLTLNGYSGVSVLTHARETFGLSIAAEEFGAKLFGNSARPGGVISHPGKLSPDARKRLREAIDNASSKENALKSLVLDEGMKWEMVTISPEDAQFLDTRKFQRASICGLFRVPPHKIGDFERATFSNIEETNSDYVGSSLIPHAKRIELSIKQQLLSPAERKELYAEFLFDSQLRGNTESRYKAHKMAIESGIMSPNEVREKENLNKRTDSEGDAFWKPANMDSGKSQSDETEVAQNGN